MQGLKVVEVSVKVEMDLVQLARATNAVCENQNVMGFVLVRPVKQQIRHLAGRSLPTTLNRGCRE